MIHRFYLPLFLFSLQTLNLRKNHLFFICYKIKFYLFISQKFPNSTNYVRFWSAFLEEFLFFLEIKIEHSLNFIEKRSEFDLHLTFLFSEISKMNNIEENFKKVPKIIHFRQKKSDQNRTSTDTNMNRVWIRNISVWISIWFLGISFITVLFGNRSMWILVLPSYLILILVLFIYLA